MGHIGILGTTVPNISYSCLDINYLLFPYFLRTIIVVAYCWVPFRSKFCFLNSPHAPKQLTTRMRFGISRHKSNVSQIVITLTITKCDGCTSPTLPHTDMERFAIHSKRMLETNRWCNLGKPHDQARGQSKTVIVRCP